jgi:Tfp pilus assembly protein PilZ
MRERSAVRVTPRSAITVVIENGGLPFAYGVVANISEAGVCVWTNGRFEVGESLVLRLSFAREPQPFQASGVIVWGDAYPERGAGSDVRYGLQLGSVESPAREHLRSLISASA